MITYTKSIEMGIYYFGEGDSKKSKKILNLRSPKFMDTRISNPIEINIPGTDEWITVDAYYMREACDKLLAFQKI